MLELSETVVPKRPSDSAVGSRTRMLYRLIPAELTTRKPATNTCLSFEVLHRKL